MSKGKGKPCAVCDVFIFPERAAKTCSDECAAELKARSRARYRANNMPRIRFLDRTMKRRLYPENGPEIAARELERYRANRDTINARRRELRALKREAAP